MAEAELDKKVIEAQKNNNKHHLVQTKDVWLPKRMGYGSFVNLSGIRVIDLIFKVREEKPIGYRFGEPIWVVFDYWPLWKMSHESNKHCLEDKNFVLDDIVFFSYSNNSWLSNSPRWHLVATGETPP